MRTAKLVADASARSVRALRGPNLGRDSMPSPGGEPQDVWSRLEDLFRRIAVMVPVSVQVDADGARIVLHGLLRVRHPALGELRHAAQEHLTYAWQTGDARGSFVKTLERRGPELVCTLVSPKRIERWPGGEQLCCNVRRFLVDLGRQRLVDGRWR